MSTNNRYLGGILLVAGTCIGAGMIGVPVKTAAAGFYPTLLAFVVVWGIMTISALLFLEASLAFPGETNFISMTKATLGSTGKNIAWLASLFYMYSMMASYTTGGATMIVELLKVNVNVSIIIYLLPFILMLYLGAKWLDLVNRFLTIGLIGSFILLCFSILIGAHSLQPVSTLHINTHINHSVHVLTFALPLLVTTFGYHVIIPSLKFYLHEDVSILKKTILIGSAIPLVVYVVWQIVVLLLIPIFGDEGLVSMLSANKNPGDSITSYLLKYGQHKSVLVSLIIFTFCAISSSLIGVAWSLYDFFADGFNITKNNIGKLILISLTFVPPIIYAVIFPQGFLKALSLSGAFATIVMIIYPALMVYKIRYNKAVEQGSVKYKVPVGATLIIMIALFGAAVVLLGIC
jgi:tyrosine-specific transport protein